MKLEQLISIGRYLRCRKVFRRPLGTHLRLTRARSRPTTISLRAGGNLHVPNVKSSRTLFNWLLNKSPNPLPISAEDGVLIFRHQNSSIALRPIDTDFFTFEELFLRDAYRLDDHHEPLGDVIDLGANIGLFSVRVAPFAKRVIAIEPVADNLAIARRNIQLASLQSKVTLHERAISDQTDSTLRLFLSSSNCGGHSVCREHAAQWGSVKYQDVPTLSLPDLFEREGIERCSLLKCDIEGAEFDVFRTVPPDLLARIDRIIMEVHLTVPAWGHQEFRLLCQKLETCGFSVDHEPIGDSRDGKKIAFMLFATNSRVAHGNS